MSLHMLPLKMDGRFCATGSMSRDTPHEQIDGVLHIYRGVEVDGAAAGERLWDGYGGAL